MHVGPVGVRFPASVVAITHGVVGAWVGWDVPVAENDGRVANRCGWEYSEACMKCWSVALMIRMTICNPV